jgi:5-deoxy-glucuronate isomerase
MKENLIRHPSGFAPGYTAITRFDDTSDAVLMDFGILKLAPGERFEGALGLETAYLLMDGSLTFEVADERHHVARRSLFDEDPLALHHDAKTAAWLVAETACEVAIFRTKNDATFGARLFDGENMLESEHRGRGLMGDTAYRIVRTIFDGRNRPEARLVLGEVVNFPGRWSSYPPHHHAQPELYHYRFTEPQGYGHGELGDDVYKVRQYDTLTILDERDHAQVAAPGYGMYYIWGIRHLPEATYTVPVFTEGHRWVMQPDADIWEPKP